MKIWKMNLSYKGKSNFTFCKERNIIGHGWALQKYKACNYDEYEKFTKLEERYYKDGKFDYALKCAINGLRGMNPGDLVLLHDKHKRFYICIVTGEIKVNQEPEYCEANITCNREVRFLPHSLTVEELKKSKVEPRHCIARHTIERMLTEDREELEKYIKRKYSSYLF